MLALLDHGHRRAVFQDPLRGAVDVPVARELTRLGIVHHEDVDVPQQVQQPVALGLDPIVHGVARHQLRLRDLIQYPELQLGVDVAEEHEARGAKRRRQLGPEAREHAEPRLQSLAARQVVGVFRLPAERLPVGSLDAAQVHAAGLEFLEGAQRVVVADHAHDLNGVEDGAGRAEEHRRSAGGIRSLAERGGDRIESDRADDEQTHGYIRSGAEMPSTTRPLASTWRTARASTRRACSCGAGSPSTRYL